MAAQPIAVRVLSALKVGAVDVASGVGADGVPPLLTALKDADGDIASRARAALVGLTQQAAKDAVCAQWAKSRDADLAAVIVEGRHVAAQPIAVRVLSALKTGQLTTIDSPETATYEALAAALGDADAQIAGEAGRMLAQVRDQALLDGLCEYAIAHPESPLSAAATQCHWRHSDEATDCLYLFFSDQMDDYFAQDMECAYLAAFHHQGDAVLQQRIRAKIERTGDQRLFPVLRAGAATSDLQAEIAIAQRSDNCRALFAMVGRARFRQVMEIIEHLRKAKWEPEEDDERAYYQELLQHYAALAVLLQQADSQIRQGGLEGMLADEALSGRSEQELRQAAQSGSPLGRASALYALAARHARDLQPLVQQALGDQSWVLRMAALLAAPSAGLSLSIEAIEACLGDRVAQLGAAAVQGILEIGLRQRTAEDIRRLEGLVTSVSRTLQASDEARKEAGRVLALLLCILRHEITDIAKAPEAHAGIRDDAIARAKLGDKEVR